MEVFSQGDLRGEATVEKDTQWGGGATLQHAEYTLSQQLLNGSTEEA